MARNGVRALGAALALILACVATASAHAQLVTSSPGAGQVVAEAPEEMRLSFSEPIEPGYTSADVSGRGGSPVVTRMGAPDPADAEVLVVPLPPLDDGAYTVVWRTLSATDGHVISGFFVFGVGDVQLPAGASGSATGGGALHPGQTAPVAAADALARFAGTGGLMLAFGLGVIGWLVLRPTLGRLPPRLLVAQAGALGIAAVGGLLLLVVNAAAASSPSGAISVSDYATQSRTGQLILARALLCGAAAGVAAIVLRRSPNLAAILAVAAAVVGIALVAMTGHAAGYDAVGPIVALIVHVAAAGVWIAGLACLLALALTGSGRSALQAAVPRFSALALVSVGLTVISGIYAGWLATAQLIPLDTPYGIALAVKAALVVAALGLGLFHYLEGGRGRLIGFRLRLGAEFGLGLAAIAVAANLASATPPAEGRPIAIAPASGQPEGDASLALAPGVTGVNTVRVEFATAPQPGSAVELLLDRGDVDIGQSVLPLHPVDEQGVQIAHSMPSGSPGGVPAASPSAEHGAAVTSTRYAASGLDLPAYSRWHAALIVREPTGAEVRRRGFAWTMSATVPVEGRVVPLVDPPLAIAVGLLAAALLGASYWIGGGRIPRTNPEVSRVALPSGAVLAAVTAAAILLAGPST